MSRHQDHKDNIKTSRQFLQYQDKIKEFKKIKVGGLPAYVHIIHTYNIHTILYTQIYTYYNTLLHNT